MPGSSHRKRFAIFAAIALSIIVLDLWTKWLAFGARGAEAVAYPEPHVVNPPETIVVIPGFFEIECSANRGGFRGWFKDVSWLLTAVSAAALCVFPFIVARTRSLWLTVAVGLLFGGTAGNLWDRIHFGAVRDSIKIYWLGPNHQAWPNFNIADSAISVGVVMIILGEFLGRSKAKEG